MSTIRAGTTTTTALQTTGDTTGNITLQPDSGLVTVSATGALGLPSGTTAQRPASPVAGQARYNTTLLQTEIYSGTAWVGITNQPYSVDYLVVAGGGAGGGSPTSSMTGGGGGAGGYVASFVTVTPLTSYTVTIGAGGAIVTNDRGNSGSNSVFSAFTAIGGGGGGGGIGANGTAPGLSGGSGGGSAGWFTGTVPGGAGTSGQGNAGGTGGVNNGAAAGGGAGAVGGDGNASGIGGNGGVGLNWQSLGTFYAGGGGGGAYNTASAASGGTGGNGGGGAGQNTTGSSLTGGSAGAANQGGGGGGAAAYNPGAPATRNGFAGGSGVVIIRYTGAQKGSGGTVTSVGGYTYHTFTSSGNYIG